MNEQPEHHQKDINLNLEQSERGNSELPGESEASLPARPMFSKFLGLLGIRLSPAFDWIVEWLQILLIAGLLAWFTMSYAMVRMQVPTGSMIPAILEGDSFFVDKLTYLSGINQPEPGDIIVFWHTSTTKSCQNGILIWRWGEFSPCRERFVKRLVAIGPAEVTISKGQIFVDGIELTDNAFDRDYVCRNSEHPDPEARRVDECPPFVVEDGQLFVLGDNTRNSLDSRFWGSASPADFIGEPFIRVLPPYRIGPMNGYFGSPR
jgi:signal peptidase I